MIKNQKQVKLTEDKLKRLVEERTLYVQKVDKNEQWYELNLNSLDGLISDLEGELAEYKSLVEGNLNCLKAKSIHDIPNILIAARLAQKISQKELAEMLGKKEQQIQRYEATDYETASWPRIVETALALNLKFDFERVEIINIDNDFEMPNGITSEQVAEAKHKFHKCYSLIL